MTAATFATARSAIAVRIAAQRSRRDRLWVIIFAVMGVLFQIGLYGLGNTSLRMPLRIGIYGMSLAMLCFLPRQSNGASHPAARLFPFIVLVLALGAFLPGGGGPLAGVAQASLYLAVLAPLVWMSRLQVDRNTFRLIALVLWMFHAASTSVGALQIRYPGTFDGAMSNVIDDDFKGAMTITLANGQRLLRPMGLTDTPGGAGSSGIYTIILGLGLLLTERSMLLRSTVVASMAVGLFSIYLSQGRTSLVIVAVAAIALLAVLFLRGDRRRAGLVASVLAGVALVGTSVAFAVGGDMTVDRWATLVADDPRTVAYANRGQFIDAMVQQDIYLYPLGAGGGRWGMMNFYFAEPKTDALWAEMMWQALLYDGGLPLIGLYIGLLGTILAFSWRTAVTSPDDGLGCWAGVMVGFNFATIAASFVFPIYIKDVGMQMILLNACLYGVVKTARRADPGGDGVRPVVITQSSAAIAGG